MGSFPETFRKLNEKSATLVSHWISMGHTNLNIFETCVNGRQIRVKKNMRFKKYPDSCEGGLALTQNKKHIVVEHEKQWSEKGNEITSFQNTALHPDYFVLSTCYLKATRI